MRALPRTGEIRTLTSGSMSSPDRTASGTLGPFGEVRHDIVLELDRRRGDHNLAGDAALTSHRIPAWEVLHGNKGEESYSDTGLASAASPAG